MLAVGAQLGAGLQEKSYLVDQVESFRLLRMELSPGRSFENSRVSFIFKISSLKNAKNGMLLPNRRGVIVQVFFPFKRLILSLIRSIKSSYKLHFTRFPALEIL